MVVRRRFASDARSVRDARRFVAAVLSECDMPVDALHDVVLLAVSELATNAVEHAGTDFEVVLDVAPSWLDLGVADGSPDEPRMRQAGPTDEGGRGLALLDAIAERWGTELYDDEDGKVVWCELATTSALHRR